MKIALLGPANVANRIIIAGPFVTRVVASRTVGAGIPHLQFLFVKGLPGKVRARVAHDHEPAPVAHHLRRLLHRRVALRRGANQGGIHPEAFRPDARFVRQILFPQDHSFVRAHRLAQRTARRHQVHRHHPRACGLQKTRHEQTDESLPHHQHAVSHSGFALSNGVERDCAQGRVGRLPVLNPVGHRRHQQIGQSQILRVKRALCARARDAVAQPKSAVCRIDLRHDTRGAVAQWGRRFKPVAHLLERGAPAQIAGGIQNSSHLVGTRPDFLQQVHFGLLDLHFLGADADDRVGRAHQDTAWRRDRPGHLLQLEAAVLILRDLLHDELSDTTSHRPVHCWQAFQRLTVEPWSRKPGR